MEGNSQDEHRARALTVPSGTLGRAGNSGTLTRAGASGTLKRDATSGTLKREISSGTLKRGGSTIQDTPGSPAVVRSRRFRPSCLQILSGAERRFSRQSYTITSPCTPGEQPMFPIQYDSLWHTAFFLKLTELTLAGVSVTLYALALPHTFRNCKVTFEESVGYYMSGAIFPYIVFCAYIIISGVSVLSYLLGQPMPSVLSRAFNLIGVAMFFTASGVALHRWIDLLEPVRQPALQDGCTGTPSHTLIACMCVSLLASFMHVLDVVLSLRATLKQINAIAPTTGSVRRRRGSVIAELAASKARSRRGSKDSIASSSAM